MTYFEFLLAFCGENDIDKLDFDKTMKKLIERNGIYANIDDYFDKTVSDRLTLIASDTVTLSKKEYEICILKSSD